MFITHLTQSPFDIRLRLLVYAYVKLPVAGASCPPIHLGTTIISLRPLHPAAHLIEWLQAFALEEVNIEGILPIRDTEAALASCYSAILTRKPCMFAGAKSGSSRREAARMSCAALNLLILAAYMPSIPGSTVTKHVVHQTLAGFYGLQRRLVVRHVPSLSERQAPL